MKPESPTKSNLHTRGGCSCDLCICCDDCAWDLGHMEEKEQKTQILANTTFLCDFLPVPSGERATCTQGGTKKHGMICLLQGDRSHFPFLYYFLKRHCGVQGATWILFPNERTKGQAGRQPAHVDFSAFFTWHFQSSNFPPISGIVAEIDCLFEIYFWKKQFDPT